MHSFMECNHCNHYSSKYHLTPYYIVNLCINCKYYSNNSNSIKGYLLPNGLLYYISHFNLSQQEISLQVIHVPNHPRIINQINQPLSQIYPTLKESQTLYLAHYNTLIL